MTVKIQEARTHLTHLSEMFQIVWSASRIWTLAWTALLVVQGLLPAAIVYLSRLLVDSVVSVLDQGLDGATAQPVIIYGVLMASSLLSIEIAQSLLSWIRAAQSELVRDRISSLVHQRAIELDIAQYESPDFHDRLERAKGDAGSRPIALLESIGSFIQNGITLAALAIMIIPYGAWLPAVLVVGTLPGLYVSMRFSGRFHSWWTKSTSDRRRAQYYDLMLTNSEAAPEIRLFGLGGYFQSGFISLRKALRLERINLTRDESLAKFLAGLFALVASGAVMALMVWRALMGIVTLGDLVLIYQAFIRGQGLMRTLLSSVSRVYSNSLFLGSFLEFLRLKSSLAEPASPETLPAELREGLRFNGITFRYPGSPRPMLEDFDLQIPAGKISAIVGPNGAGKSTLVKLICRFYDPDSGALEMDRVDIRNYPVEELRRHLSVLFQFPVRYQETAAHNIAVSNGSSDNERADVEEAARLAGAHDLIMGLPKGYDSVMGKWFADGTEISGGEWQRIALARAFVRKSPIMVLDEPTSMMDSWSEADWFARFRDLAKGRTSIVITHRFTTALQADVIFVMDHGKIVESGSHQELVAQDGLYAKSWKSQMEAGYEDTLNGVLKGSPLNGANGTLEESELDDLDREPGPLYVR